MDLHEDAWVNIAENAEKPVLDFRNEFYHDAYVRELGEALEQSWEQEDRTLLKKLERRLTLSLGIEKCDLFLMFVDISRRQLMRAEGIAYMKGYFIGVEAGKIIQKHELLR